MNAYLRLDHLIDKFKHDVREIIDGAVAEERASLMNKLEAFIDTDGKSTDNEIVEFVKDKVEQIQPEVIVDIKVSEEPLKKLASGGIVENSEVIIGDGAGSPSFVVPKSKIRKVTIDKTPEHEMCLNCGEKPIAENSKKYCSSICANRAGAKAAYRRKKALSR